jgi:hypothetical protein
MAFHFCVPCGVPEAVAAAGQQLPRVQEGAAGRCGGLAVVCLQLF